MKPAASVPLEYIINHAFNSNAAQANLTQTTATPPGGRNLLPLKSITVTAHRAFSL
jgi:hypothetical protein